MSKQLNINLGFTADTSQAKAQIMNLQTELTKITQTPISLLGPNSTQEINSAIKSVAQLQQHLKAATNVNTGTLDFSKLSDSIKKSGTTLQQYAQKLQSLGPIGQNAFNQLANAVAQSEIPIRRSNALLTEFATTLKNTARWQLSSSMLHGFMGGIQSAVGYAKDLNRSLNDIRIVTGKNIDEMTRFAETANRTAKSLSATTTDYTKASLIYFQQGLSDAEVKEKTDITIKLANVTQQSAEIVSDQMTAVWNNFDDGSQSLESFADKMVALGASTASSSDEIANGLQKFASIGKTIGLSFDYAASALATITAATRESEDTVGTALKTLFARIEGLKLGETLDDGTDLNKYSEALDIAGVSIKDDNDQLKDMDTILDELGVKWKTLARDQQIALAQTVAGVRQYNHFVALMDNWDSMEENLNTVANATGTLTDQSKIYEESWQAASKRVKAAMEGIYSNLIDDKAFVNILNTFEKILTYIDNVMDSMGGLNGVLTSLGALLTKVFAKQMAQGLTNMATNLRLMTKEGQAAYQQERKNTINSMIDSMGSGKDYKTAEEQTRSQYLKNNLNLQQQLLDNESKMSQYELETNKILLDRNRILGESAVNAAKSLDATSEKQSTAKFQLQTEMAAAAGGDKDVYKWNNLYFQEAAKGLRGIIQQQEAVTNSMKILGDESMSTSKKMSLISKELKASGMSAKDIDKIEKELKESGYEADVLAEKLAKLQNRELKKKSQMVFGNSDQDSMDQYAEMRDSNETDTNTGATKKSTEDYTNAIRENVRAKNQAKQANEELKNSEKAVEDSIKSATGAQKTWADTLVGCANGVLSVFSALNMLNGITKTLSNPDMSGWEKFLSIGTTIAMLIPMLVQAWQGLKLIVSSDTIATIANTAAKILNWAASKKSAQASKEEIAAQEADTASNKRNTKSELENAAAKKVNNGVTKNVGKDGKTRYFQDGKRIKNSVGEKLFNEGADKVDDVAAGGLKGKLGNWGKNIKPGLTNLGKSVGNFAKAWGPALIAVTGGILVMNAGFKVMNQNVEKAKKAAEDAKKAQENLNQAQEAYNALKSQVEDYKNANEALKSLEKGTVEYSEALNKANQSALDLIHSQKLIKGQDYELDKVTGQIKILDETKILQEELNKLQAAQAANMMAQAKAREANLQLEKDEFAKSKMRGKSGFLESKEDAGSMLVGIGGGVAAGAAIGSFIPVIGTAIGGLIGGLVGGIGGAIAGATNQDATRQEDRALEILAKEYGEQGNAVFANIEETLKGYGITDPELIKSLQENGAATQELVTAMHENAEATKMERYAHLVQITAEVAEVSSSEYKDSVLENMTDDYEEHYDDEFDAIKKDYGQDMSKLIGLYGQETGQEGLAFQKQEGDTVTFLDSKGNSITKSIDGLIGEIAGLRTDEWAKEESQRRMADITSSDVKRNVQGFIESGEVKDGWSYNDFHENTEAKDNSKIITNSAYMFNEMNQNQSEEWRTEKAPIVSKFVNSQEYQEMEQEYVNALNAYSKDMNADNLKALQDATNKYKTLVETNLPYDAIGLNLYDQLGFGAGQLDQLKPEQIQAALLEGNALEGFNRESTIASGNLQASNTILALQQFKDLEVADLLKEQKAQIDNLQQHSTFGTMENGVNFADMDLNKIENLDYISDQGQWSNFEDLIINQLAPDDVELQKKMLDALGGIDWSVLGADEQAIQLLTAENLIPEEAIEEAKEKISDFSDKFVDQKVSSAYAAAADAVGMSEEAFYAYTQQLKQTYPALQKNEAAAIRVAQAMANQEKQAKELGKKYNDLKDNLDENKRGTTEFATACADMATAMNEVFGKGTFDAEFVADPENLELVKQAMEGSAEAMAKLQDIAADRILIDAGVDLTDLDSAGAQISEWVGSQEFNDLEIGASLDDSGMTEKFNEMLANGEITVDEMNKLLTGIGFEPDIQYIDIPMENAVKDEETNTYTVTYEDPVSGETVTKTIAAENVTEAKGGGSVQIPYINGQSTNKVSSPKSLATASNNGSGGNGGGGDSGGKSKKPKVVQKKAPIEAKKEDDEIERYHEITKAIETQQHILDRLSNAKDKAYGANKIKAIDKEIAALTELNKLDSQHLNQIKEQLALDKQKLANYGATFDEYGNLNNYDELMKQKMAQWKAEQDAIQAREIAYEEAKNNAGEDEEYDADGSIKLAIEQDKKASDDAYEEFKKSISQYEDTAALFEDTVDKIRDQFDQIAEKVIEKINYKIEMEIEFNNFEIDLLDFQIEKLGDKFNNFSEIMTITAGKSQHLANNLKIQSDGIGELWAQYDAGMISLDHFQEELGNHLSEVLSAMRDILAMDKEMLEYYGSAFDTAEEEFSDYLTQIDNGISKLDHFKNMLSILGKENDNKMIDTILQAQYSSAEHRLQASTNWYNIAKTEYDALYQKWVQEKDTMGPKELEALEEQLKVARTKMQEADDQRLSDLEAVGEKAQEILQNNLDAARKKLENALVGTSLEEYMQELDRLSKKQEEYLTTTNKMYQTNNLIRQAQLDMDQTENNRAKQQYNDYIKYIEQLQESGKLSEYELSIAEAKYKLLQAQIALEEAKDAKDQVRLTRDAEGNYGYVYTANEDKVSEAEKAVADAENELYNIGLEGVQDYQSKKAEILQEAIDTFASLEEQYQTGQIESEAEFKQKMLEAKNYYYERLKEYDDLYYIALGTMQETSYGNTLDYELNSTNVFDTFASSVDSYLSDVETSFDDYDNKVQVVEDEVGGSLDELQASTKEVTTKTEELATKTDELVDTMGNELLAVRNLTLAWGEQRDEIYNNIQANQKLIEQLQEIQGYGLGHTEDYSLFINDLIANGQDADSRLVQQALRQRWEKMDGNDTNNYQQMINDYVQQYADKNGVSLEEAEQALQDDSWYKTLQLLRQYKIERTDWSAVKANVLEQDPNADTSWIDANRENKLSQDWNAKIEQYLTQNKSDGIMTNDQYLLELLGIRQAKIDSLEDKTGVVSNDDLIKKYVEQGLLIDVRGYDATINASEITYKNLTNAEIEQYAQDVANGKWNGNYTTMTQDLLNQNISPSDIDRIKLRAKEIIKQQSTPKTDNKVISQPRGELNRETQTKSSWSLWRFDTGGYTGEWGPEGKLAMLHEKELVLNKRDTENFLTATSILREISNMLDTNALVASLGAINLHAMTVNSPADQILQQEVNIQAEFPNVTDHNEIEIAIDNLINAASQHAYRT